MLDAACRHLPTSLFFPERGSSQKEAKAACARCPVAAQCDEYSERTGNEWGIWNGRAKTRDSARDDDSSVTVPASSNPTPAEGAAVNLRTLSATSATVYEGCPARWKAMYGDGTYPPDMDNDAALNGTACHEVLQQWVEGGLYKTGSTPDLLALYPAAYDKLFSDRRMFDVGVKMLSEWNDRSVLLDGREILATEKKKRFQVPTSKGDVPFNYIMDRLDRRNNGELEIVDYKTTAIPIQPDKMKRLIQPRSYALAVQLEYPEAERVWVTFDLLRYDAVSVCFTKEESRETWRYLRRLAQTIQADDRPEEKLNPDCRFCIRKFECKKLKKHVGGGGSLGVSDPNEAADRRRELADQASVIKKMVEELDGFLLEYCEQEELDEFATDDTILRVTSQKRREVNGEQVVKIVGPEVAARYGSLNVTAVEAMLKDDNLTSAQQSELRQAIGRKRGAPSTKTEPTGAFA